MSETNGQNGDGTSPREAAILRGGVNHVATAVSPCLPWEFVSNIPDHAKASKLAYAKWKINSSTRHLFYTGVEAINPGLRANDKTNPVRALHALIADYDTKINDGMLASVKDRCNPDFMPMWVSRTFSGGVRLVWFFEEPLPLENPLLAKGFLKYAKGQLAISKILPGLDEPAWMRLGELYDVGSNWQKLGGKPISKNSLYHWLFEASKSVDWKTLNEVKVPLEKVSDELEKRFPGRWEGDFVEGARGVVFFDPNSTNPTAAIVTEKGMITFSQPKIFYSWGEIFGAKWLRKYQDDKIGAAVADTWFDGRYYYLTDQKGHWWDWAKEDFTNRLRTKFGLEPSKAKNETSSEIDRALLFLQENRRIAGLIPMLFDSRNTMDINGKRFLNCAVVNPVKPAEESQQWGENFPWIAEFLEGFFDSEGQLDYFLGFWSRAYSGALRGQMSKGQAVFLVGTTGLGKTLMSTKLVGASMGGYADASDYLNSNSSFNSQLLEVGVWNIDDGTLSATEQAHRKFSEMVKRIVANPLFNYHAKFKNSLTTEWNGRLIVTLNDDEYSMKMLPNLAESMEEKIMIFRCSKEVPKFPTKQVLESMIQKELPFFLRWLVDWELPEKILGTNRFGVKAFIHEEVRIQTLRINGCEDVLELIEIWKRHSAPQGWPQCAGGYWTGTASDFIALISKDDSLRSLNRLTARVLGKKLAEVAQFRNDLVQVIKPNTRRVMTNYRIKVADVGEGQIVSPIEELSSGRVDLKPVPEESLSAS